MHRDGDSAQNYTTLSTRRVLREHISRRGSGTAAVPDGFDTIGNEELR
jgi:hypothetical protein